MAKRDDRAFMRELHRLSGILESTDDRQMVAGVIPGLKNATEHCQEAAKVLAAVARRLEDLEKAAMRDSAHIHLPAEASFLAEQLRGALRNVLSAEKPIRSCLTSLDHIGQ